MLVTSEPVAAALISSLILGEAMQVSTVIGIGLILLGIVVMNRKERIQ